ncbi:MAG: hypothetical protein ACRDHP_18895 [Ktedonobacterales bacterium]
MADMDQGIKRLIQTHPRDVLRFAMPEAEFLGTLPVDVATEPQLVLDTLLRIRLDGQECAVDLEAEASPREGIARRLCDYGSRARVVTGLTVFSVVLWLEPGGKPPTSPYTERIGDRVSVDWHFTGIELYRENAESLLAGGVPGLLPLVPFCRGGTDLGVIARTAELVKAEASAGEVSELEALLAVFAARRHDARVIQQLIERILMSTEIIGTSSLYQEWVRKATEEGMAQGMAQGMRESLLLALRGRFGEVTPEVERAIAAADAERLRDTVAHVAMETPEQLAARLGAGGTGNGGPVEPAQGTEG